MLKRVIVSTFGIALAAGAAAGQTVSIVNDGRYIEGSTDFYVGDTEFYSENSSYPPDSGIWQGSLSFSGNGSIGAAGNQNGGFDGTSAFRIDGYTMSASCGGGPGTSGTALITDHFEYTFEVLKPSTYTLDVAVACGAGMSVNFAFSGPSVSYSETTANNGPAILHTGETGSLATGQYTIILHGAGGHSFVGPGGGGTGGGGATPTLVLAITPVCSADFNGDGFVDFFDFNDFVTCFEGGSCPDGTTADFNGDGFADFFDFTDFVTAFEAGC